MAGSDSDADGAGPEATGGGDDPAAEEGADADRTVTVLTREDCNLCGEAIETVRKVTEAVDRTVAVRVIDVDEAGLADEYGDRVPYVFVDDRPAFKFRVDATALRAELTN
ncbi:MAG: glutaredoxin family protein [Haloarculaceae archaeon]